MEAKAPRQLRFEVGGGLSTQDLSVWRSNEKEQFVRLADLRPQQGVVTLALDPNSIYSLTTTRGGRRRAAGFDQGAE